MQISGLPLSAERNWVGLATLKKKLYGLALEEILHFYMQVIFIESVHRSLPEPGMQELPLIFK